MSFGGKQHLFLLSFDLDCQFAVTMQHPDCLKTGQWSCLKQSLLLPPPSTLPTKLCISEPVWAEVAFCRFTRQDVCLLLAVAAAAYSFAGASNRSHRWLHLLPQSGGNVASPWQKSTLL